MLAILYSIMAHTFVIIQLAQVTNSFRAIMKNIKINIYQLMNQRIRKNRLFYKNIDITKKLKNIHRSFLLIYCNSKYLNRCMELTNFVWIIISVISLITNFYLILQYWHNHPIMKMITFLQIRNNVVLFLVLILLKHADYFSQVNDYFCDN